VASKSTDWV